MKFFAQLDATLTVVSITEGTDDTNELALSARTGGTYRQTYPDKSKRKNFAGIGYIYDRDKDAFIPPKPYASWILDENTCSWKAPSDKPGTDKEYDWNESKKEWEHV